MPEELPKVYEGDRPYIFVSYAHADRDAVLPIIAAFVDGGYRVWYDDGIQPATDFPSYIADRLHDCACLLMLVSRSYLASAWCRNEVGYALDLGKTILPVYLEDVELDRALRMRLGTVQALHWCGRTSDEVFYRRLFATPALYPCLTDEGKKRQGVRPRPDGKGGAGFQATERQTVDRDARKAGDTRPESGASQPYQRAASQSSRALSVGVGGEVDNGGDGHVLPLQQSAKDVVALGLAPKAGLAAYSWAELKVLSQAIAAAGSDAEGLVIARRYNLVDKDGRLRGETKAIKLKGWRGTTAKIRILGFRHDELAAGGRAGISFEFADVPATHRMNGGSTNEGGWETSGMRRWLNDGRRGFLSLLPDDLRACVATAAKRTNNRGEVTSRNDASPVTATHDTLWLLSMSEVYGRLSSQGENVPWSPATYDAEGTQYQLYADWGVTTWSYGSCKKDGASSWWWLRSSGAGGTYRFRYVYETGGWSGGGADGDLGVSPGFCF